jgi:E3 ubiquitin-protein ligase DOA10
MKRGRSTIKNVMDISKKEQDRRMKQIQDLQNKKANEDQLTEKPKEEPEDNLKDINLRMVNQGVLEFPDSNVEEGFKIPNVTKESIYDFRDNVEYEEPTDKDKKNFEIV